MCELCDAVKTGSHTEFGPFVLIPECRTCGEPMLVFKEHKAELSLKERREFREQLRRYFIGFNARGIGMRSITDHWHEHLVMERST